MLPADDPFLNVCQPGTGWSGWALQALYTFSFLSTTALDLCGASKQYQYELISHLSTPNQILATARVV